MRRRVAQAMNGPTFRSIRSSPAASNGPGT